MKQVLFKEDVEVLTLEGLKQPLSVEETIHYLRATANQLEECL